MKIGRKAKGEITMARAPKSGNPIVDIALVVLPYVLPPIIDAIRGKPNDDRR